MQQLQLTTNIDIGEVRTVTGAATCNQLRTFGWVLLGIYPLAMVGEMAEGRSRGEQEQRQSQCAAFGGLCCGEEARVG
jgi:hypothetical protein